MSIKDQLKDQASVPSAGGDLYKFTAEGDEVAGRVTAVRFGVTTQYGEADFIDVTDEDRGPLTFIAGSYHLRSALVEGNNQLGRPVQPGDEVYVRFDGKVKTKNGNDLNQYAVALRAGSAKTLAAQATPTGAPATDGSDGLDF